MSLCFCGKRSPVGEVGVSEWGGGVYDVGGSRAPLAATLGVGTKDLQQLVRGVAWLLWSL